jgi:hypothetical protein
MKTKITRDEPGPAPSEPREELGPRSTTSRDSSGRAGRVIGLVALGLVAVLGVVALAAGGALLWVDSAKTDADGFYRSAPHQFETSGRALVTNDLDLDSGIGSFMLGSGHLGEIQLTSTSNDPAKELFVGIAPEQDVAAYLSGVQIDEVSDVELDPFQASYTPRPGDALPTPPADVSIWAASASGAGSQTLVWPAEEGDWSVVVMNADGSPGVDADIAAAATAPFIFRVGLGLLVGGVLVTLVAVAAGVSVRRAGRRSQSPSVAVPAA